jgi:RNA polymerase sigma-70 factor, ECF subfamily
MIAMTAKDKLDDSGELTVLRQAAAGNAAAWTKLLEPHRARLRHMIELRMDRRLKGRLDASDVLQDAMFEAFRVLPSYLENRRLPFFLWMRWLAGMKLQALHRKHLGGAG